MSWSRSDGNIFGILAFGHLLFVPFAVCIGDDGEHWAFQTIQQPALPQVADTSWPRNPIDYFVLARLEQRRVAPSAEADRWILLRRLYLDLGGVPPALRDIERFDQNAAADSWDQLVERLLDSPTYGERWGRHWLDLARYADSHGYEADQPRSVWPYRDWVIAALNADMTFDQFVLQQLAGDLLPQATRDQQVATGFLRCNRGHPAPEAARLQGIVDRVNTVGVTLLGLTLGCAQCHDHKLDAVTQQEYYQMFAFFNNSAEPKLELATPAELARRDAHQAQQQSLQQEFAKYEKQLLLELSQRLRAGTKDEKIESLSAEEREILSMEEAKRAPAQVQLIKKALVRVDVGYRSRKETLDSFTDQKPVIVTSPVLQELDKPRQTHVFLRGNFEALGDAVSATVPGFLSVVTEASESHANRLDFARWLISNDHPLTARVLVNRVWQRYFGTGLVSTENDFGLSGAYPSHPRLLDWLAAELIRHDWSLKHLHRLITSSATYRQASHTRLDLQELDPQGRWLAQQQRLRLEAEIIRDQAMAASGLLNVQVGGPSVFPFQSDGVMHGRADKSTWKMDEGAGRYRRGIYVHFWRLTPHPYLRAFDAPDANESCTRRVPSNTASQALVLLNHPWFAECAVAMAARVHEHSESDDDRLRFAFQLCLTRPPAEPEMQALSELLAARRATLRSSPQKAKEILSAAITVQEGDPVELAAWAGVTRAILNLDECINRE